MLEPKSLREAIWASLRSGVPATAAGSDAHRARIAQQRLQRLHYRLESDDTTAKWPLRRCVGVALWSARSFGLRRAPGSLRSLLRGRLDPIGRLALFFDILLSTTRDGSALPDALAPVQLSDSRVRASSDRRIALPLQIAIVEALSARFQSPDAVPRRGRPGYLGKIIASNMTRPRAGLGRTSAVIERVLANRDQIVTHQTPHSSPHGWFPPDRLRLGDWANRIQRCACAHLQLQGLLLQKHHRRDDLVRQTVKDNIGYSIALAIYGPSPSTSSPSRSTLMRCGQSVRSAVRTPTYHRNRAKSIEARPGFRPATTVRHRSRGYGCGSVPRRHDVHHHERCLCPR